MLQARPPSLSKQVEQFRTWLLSLPASEVPAKCRAMAENRHPLFMELAHEVAARRKNERGQAEATRQLLERAKRFFLASLFRKGWTTPDTVVVWPLPDRPGAVLKIEYVKGLVFELTATVNSHDTYDIRCRVLRWAGKSRGEALYGEVLHEDEVENVYADMVADADLMTRHVPDVPAPDAGPSYTTSPISEPTDAARRGPGVLPLFVINDPAERMEIRWALDGAGWPGILVMQFFDQSHDVDTALFYPFGFETPDAFGKPHVYVAGGKRLSHPKPDREFQQIWQKNWKGFGYAKAVERAVAAKLEGGPPVPVVPVEEEVEKLPAGVTRVGSGGAEPRAAALEQERLESLPASPQGGRQPVTGRRVIELANVQIDAVSLGGIETCIGIPSWRTCFDIGRCPPSAVRAGRVCFTHTHMDHVGGVLHHVSLRDLYGMPPPEYLVPEPHVAAFRDLLDAARRLDRDELPCEIVPVEAGMVLPAGPKRQIRVFRSYHRIPTVGYALESVRSVLRTDLRGLSGAEIAALRARGESVSEDRVEVEVAFCGDTLIDVVDREPVVREARVLVLECTYLDDWVPVEEARRKGHVHLDEIAARADLFRNKAILLTHFSAHYRPEQIVELLDRKLPPDLRARVTPLLS